jgi:hypothetical protein
MAAKGERNCRDALRCGAVLSLIAVMAFGCGPDLQEVRTKHSKAIEAKMASLSPIREQVRTTARTSRDMIQIPAGPVVTSLASVTVEGENTAVCYAEDLADPLELGFVWRRLPGTGLLNECASVAVRGHEPYNPAYPPFTLHRPLGFSAESLFKRCEAVRFLFVIRTFEFVEPSQPTKTLASASVPAPISSSHG